MSAKSIKSKFLKKIILLGLIFIVIVLMLDYIILPWWVNREEVSVPNVVGKSEQEAFKLLEEKDLTPILSDTTFNESFPRGTIVLQRPDRGSIVKTGRRIYLFLSGGEPTVLVPLLKGKSVRDAKFALERLGLKLGNVEQAPSNTPQNMIFDQEYAEGTPLKKGQSVSIFVSSGVESGEILVPDLIGKSLIDASKILADSLLKIGKINYQISFSLLPNTIIDQYPSRGTKLNQGDAVDLFVTKAGDEHLRNEVEEN